jgi:hypothetical protein
MDALRSALPLARLLFALAEHRRSASVLVRSSSRLAEIELSHGRIVRVDGVESEPLGDTLLRGGALDQARHGAALAEDPPAGPVGEWLVQVGAAPREAVDRALVEQLHARLVRVFTWAQPHATLVPAGSASAAKVSADLVRAVWEGLLTLAREKLPALPTQHAAYTTTRRGLRILAQLRHAGIDVDAALSARGPASHESGAVLLRTLLTLGGLERDADSYSLLLRKQRELRRRATPSELLDLPERAGPAEARRAFKRLASRLHPDRFHGDAPELFALSSEILRALAGAEALLRRAREAG